MYTFLAIACLFGAAAAAPSGYGLGGYEEAINTYSIPRYEFNYAVNDPQTGDNKAQKEVREGDVVKGSYSLAEPDGTIRVVDYSADALRGFNAVVRRIGKAVHPQVIAPVVAKQIVQPVYEQVAPIAPIIGEAISYSNLLGYGGYDLGGLGLGLKSLDGGLGLGLKSLDSGLGLGLKSLDSGLGLGLSGLGGYGGWKN